MALLERVWLQYFDRTLLPTRVSFYLMIALAGEIRWHVAGGPSNGINDWQHSRAITVIMVGG